jgi:hypothetical protein
MPALRCQHNGEYRNDDDETPTRLTCRNATLPQEENRGQREKERGLSCHGKGRVVNMGQQSRDRREESQRHERFADRRAVSEC